MAFEGGRRDLWTALLADLFVEALGGRTLASMRRDSIVGGRRRMRGRGLAFALASLGMQVITLTQGKRQRRKREAECAMKRREEKLNTEGLRAETRRGTEEGEEAHKFC